MKRLPSRLLRIREQPHFSEVLNLVVETQSLVERSRQTLTDARQVVDRARTESARWCEQRSQYSATPPYLDPQERGK